MGVNIECEALRVAKRAEQLKVQEKDALLEKQSLLRDKHLQQQVEENKESATRMETTIAEEREIASCLMSKLRELTAKLHALTEEKLLSQRHAKERDESIFTLQGIIANGEVKLSHFKSVITRSHEEQERRIMKEVKLKKELALALASSAGLGGAQCK